MNIILIVIDTLRYDHVGAHGNSGIRTPNLDRLAAMSWVFDRAFAASFPTIPHRTDTITGRYGAPFHPWKPLDCDKPTIPQALAEAGYCTQLLHDTPHLVNGGHRFDYPFHAWMPIRGAEVDRAWITDNWDYFDHWCHDPLFDFYPRGIEALREGWPQISLYIQTNRHRQREEEWSVAQLFTTAARFLRDNSRRENFFLWLDCFDPHEPWDTPPEYVLMYDRTPCYDGRVDPRTFLGRVRNSPQLSPEGIERIRATYAANVTLVDRWFGVLLDTLEETGLIRNTAILLTSDHGTNLADRSDLPFGKKAPPRENESHVPFILYVPGEGSGRCDAIVQPQDIFATLARIGGAPVPSEIESYDALEIAQEGKEPRGIALSGAVVRGWKRPDQILFSAFTKEWRLGFAADPKYCELERLGSGENVADQHPEVVEELHRAALEEIARRGLDPVLVDWLRNRGYTEIPPEYRVTDAHPAPAGWRVYWQNVYRGQ